MLKTTEFKMIPKTELSRELENLKDHLVEKKFTISHMAFLTGWTENYLRILERRGRIPQAQRTEGTIKARYWSDDGARAILYFKKQQGKRTLRPPSSNGSG